MLLLPTTPTLFPYTTLFRSISTAKDTTGNAVRTVGDALRGTRDESDRDQVASIYEEVVAKLIAVGFVSRTAERIRSEEHTSELQSHHDIVCRLPREKQV